MMGCKMIPEQDELIAAWHGDETFVEVSERLGLSIKRVRILFARLAHDGYVPHGHRMKRIGKRGRPHVFPKERKRESGESVDHLLMRLREVHGNG
jgi:predicted ArsR family transcriptional regulator